MYSNPNHQPLDNMHIFKEDELENVIDRCKLNRPKEHLLGDKSKINEESDEDIGYRESDEEEDQIIEPVPPPSMKQHNS